MTIEKSRGRPPKPKKLNDWIDHGQWLLDNIDKKDRSVRDLLGKLLGELSTAKDVETENSILDSLNELRVNESIRPHWPGWSKHISNTKSGVTKVEISEKDMRLLTTLKELNHLPSNSKALAEILSSISVLFPYYQKHLRELKSFFNSCLNENEWQDAQIDDLMEEVKTYKTAADELEKQLEDAKIVNKAVHELELTSNDLRYIRIKHNEALKSDPNIKAGDLLEGALESYSPNTVSNTP